MQIDINKLFPSSNNPLVPQGPLPRQLEFLQKTFDKDGPKFIAYVGGVGSGKTMSLCINILSQAIIYGGIYIIGRQHAPELRRTTLKTFLDICPKELIIEYRIADMEVKLKSATGKPAIIYFVGLDESDKLRSLNLSGAGIDECTQVGEGAFMLLLNRLRNPDGLRKIVMAGNPAGHDWVYHRFAKKDVFETSEAADMHYLIKAPSTENTHLGQDYLDSMKAIYSKEKYDTEVLGSFDSFIGQVYDEFVPAIHVIPPFKLPDHWTRVLGIDHGFRNAAAGIYGAVDGDGNIYVYKEFYQREWLIQEIVEGKGEKPGLLGLLGEDKLEVAAIDPSTRALRNEGTNNSKQRLEKFSDYDIYCKYLPEDFPLICANNEVTAGIDRVKSYMKIDSLTKKPRLRIFSTCTTLIDEILSYRWQELPDSQQGLRSNKETVVKVNDHSLDALRYMIMTQPNPTSLVEDIYKDMPYNSLQASMRRELESFRKAELQDKYESDV